MLNWYTILKSGWLITKTVGIIVNNSKVALFYILQIGEEKYFWKKMLDGTQNQHVSLQARGVETQAEVHVNTSWSN